jgi:hypothetical protein
MSNLAPPLDDEWLPPVPDALDLVIETDAMVAMFVAERYLRIESMRQDALADARRYGEQLSEVSSAACASNSRWRCRSRSTLRGC